MWTRKIYNLNAEPEARRALSQAGILLTQVEKLQDATSLDGLACIWGTASDTNVLGHALSLTSEALAQLQAAAESCFAQPIVWITRQVVGARFVDDKDNSASVNGRGNSHDDAEGRSLAAAPLWGLMRTARSKHPELRLRSIDLELENSTYDSLAPALILIYKESECARSPLNGKISRIVAKGGTVLITRGLGGIGKQVARWLATTYNVRSFVLASRRGLKTPGADSVVADLKQLGANVFGGDVYPAPEVDAELVLNYFRGIEAARKRTTNGI
ncbi:hypothetical protein PG995_011356 [Apiospora arundinis]